MGNLVEKAKKFNRRGKYKYSEAEIELCVAVMNGEITYNQLKHAMGWDETRTGATLYYRVYLAVKEGIQRGLIAKVKINAS